MILHASRGALLALLLVGASTSAVADDEADEYRVTVVPTYALTEVWASR